MRHMDESFRTCAFNCVQSYTWMSPATLTNETWDPCGRCRSAPPLPQTCTSKKKASPVTLKWVFLYLWMSPITCEWVTAQLNVSRHNYEQVTSHTWTLQGCPSDVHGTRTGPWSKHTLTAVLTDCVTYTGAVRRMGDMTHVYVWHDSFVEHWHSHCTDCVTYRWVN